MNLAFLLIGSAIFWNPSIQQPPRDFSCAVFHPSLGKDELVSRFGAENVADGEVYGDDDGPISGTILFPNRSGAKVEIAWRDTDNRKGPSWIRIRGDSSEWIAPNGITVGQDLRSIERKNGWPFQLAGFTTEGGYGRVITWGIGRLGNVQNCSIKPYFQPAAAPAPRAIGQVTHLARVSSGHPAMQEINPRVVALQIEYEDQKAGNPADALFNLLLWWYRPLDAAAYVDTLRGPLESYLRVAASYIPSRLCRLRMSSKWGTGSR